MNWYLIFLVAYLAAMVGRATADGFPTFFGFVIGLGIPAVLALLAGIQIGRRQ